MRGSEIRGGKGRYGPGATCTLGRAGASGPVGRSGMREESGVARGAGRPWRQAGTGASGLAGLRARGVPRRFGGGEGGGPVATVRGSNPREPG